MLYVQASLLALHVNEQPDSATSHWVRINTPVEVLDERGDMLQVRLLDRPEEHPVTGWVVGEYLDTEVVTLRVAHDNVFQHRAGDDELLEMWSSRRDALSNQWNREPEPVAHVGYCETDRVMYLGTLSEAEGFTPATSGTPLRGLSTHHWMRVGEEPVVGSPFVQPFRTGTWNEEGRSAFAPGSCDGICDSEEEYKTVLGPCEDDGAFYVSSHVVTSPRTPPQDRVEIVENVGTWIGGAGGMEIRIQTTYQNRYGDGDPPVMPTRTWLDVGDRRFLFLPTDGKTWAGMRVYELLDDGMIQEDEVGLYGRGC